MDIRHACASIEETPRIIGDNHKSADDEMTIKCAYHRNCRFLDNDNYREWKGNLHDAAIRTWLECCQDFLQMRFYFDVGLGAFDTLDGNIPASGLAKQAQLQTRLESQWAHKQSMFPWRKDSY